MSLKSFKVTTLLVLLMTIVCSCSLQTKTRGEVNLIPRPASLQELEGTFMIDKSTKIYAEVGNQGAHFAARFLERELGVQRTDSKSDADIIIVSSTKKGEEAYTLDVTKTGVKITSSGSGGLFYGAVSLKQLVDKQVHGTTAHVACVKIEDAPRFSWRGMHLDVSRHFFPKKDILTYLDMLAEYKINRFHWHLIDDGGWRLEIKKYPKLTEIGAWRNKESFKWSHRGVTFPLVEDPNAEVYGGFYTQEDVKEIVAYAAERNIVVVPEIEMPGHIMPVLACYPHFGSAPGNKLYSEKNLPKGVDLETYRKGTWKYQHQNVADVSKPEVVQFFKDVLDETFELFPSEWIHIGGDEVQKIYWEHSEGVAKMMKEKGLKDQHEVQAHFIRHMEEYISSKGRKLVGWDEIVDGGLGEDSIVMYWIGYERMKKALEQGNQVVMSPTGPTYFDYGYAGNSTKKVYEWNPRPEGLTPAQEKNLIGAQANVWTERMEDWARVEHMVLPRMLSLAETTWTPLEGKNFDEFYNRLQRHYQYFDAKGYNYRLPEVTAPLTAVFFETEAAVVLDQAKNPNWTIRYTIDGSKPTVDSPVYTEPIKVTEDTMITAAYFSVNGSSSEKVTRIVAKKPTKVEATDLVQGLDVQFYDFKIRNSFQLSKKKSKKSYKESYFNMKPYKGKDNFSLRYTGFIKIEKDGEYTFSTASDDGSTLAIAGALVVDNSGFHSYTEKKGQVVLTKGVYPIEVTFSENGGGEQLDVFIQASGEEKIALPKELLFRKK